MARKHNLQEIWVLVLRDAKPKIDEDAWKNYDVPFAEKVIAEFDAVDQKGFAFRDPRQRWGELPIRLSVDVEGDGARTADPR